MTDDLNLRVARACNFEHRIVDGMVEITYVNERGITVEKYFRPQSCWDDAMLAAMTVCLFEQAAMYVDGNGETIVARTEDIVFNILECWPQLTQDLVGHESGPTCVSLAVCKLKETANAEVG